MVCSDSQCNDYGFWKWELGLSSSIKNWIANENIKLVRRKRLGYLNWERELGICRGNWESSKEVVKE